MDIHQIIFLAILVFIGSHLQATEAKTSGHKLESVYRMAQREFNRQNYKDALPLLETYLKKSKNHSYKRQRLFWVIDQIGRIQLRVNKDPAKAINFFKKLIDDESRLSEDELDDIRSWMSAAKDWQKSKSYSPKGISGEALFFKGKAYYKKAKNMLGFPADEKGDAYFNISATYLVPFITNNDNSKHIGEALYSMGDIRHRLRTDPEYWNDNYYLKETIRRFPGKPIAKRAWELLDLDVRFGYTGSSGDHTPPEMVAMLKRYKSIAYMRSSKKILKTNEVTGQGAPQNF